MELCAGRETPGIFASPPTYLTIKGCSGVFMRQYIEERAVEIARYIIQENATVRRTAQKFGVSKSTVHKDLTDRLGHIDPALAREARKVLEVNKAERHIRGGMATREKYLNLSGDYETKF